MDAERHDVDVLTEYFTELYRSDESLYKPASNLLKDFMEHRVIPSDALESEELINALSENDEIMTGIVSKESFEYSLRNGLIAITTGL